MSLNFAGISPHPPIIIPKIGSLDDLQKVGNTILAMKKLSSTFKNAEIDTLIVISPHMLVYPDKFSICGMKKLFGTFAQFDHPDIVFDYESDIDLAIEIDKKAKSEGIKTLLYNNDGEFFELDHGLMVPLYYLKQQQETAFKVLPIAYSNLDRAAHFSFGQIIRDVAKTYPGRVGILASGDLSHQLLQNNDGQEFDRKIVEDIKKSNVKNILYYEDEFIEAAGECGYRSILILLGVLDGIKAKMEILSYEGPFGVGYLVANYTLKES
ncbi:MAG: Extradiol ring-cleavage dioxygenase class III protein subunit B [Berkelbacteria bacterium GW2011_GWA1_39_10]|uniref:Extradiol ring-cleavage dioxygenase class III protein subunit B n=1 Tax=Berkelbacteria bacterium GW2011_GWA1_39_10 TaxID=1618332 RepID=A0A0G0LR10_9BACT|nr:MAG: Extradiol ring-cleavage dioxygenase class III protein subunit B [Berkelbacteria bacterium GW2011_GWA1_39_10]